MSKSGSGSKTTSKTSSRKSKSGGGKSSKTTWTIPVDNHPGSHDTKSIPNPTLNPDGTQKMGHGHPKLTGEEMSKMGKDKVIAKMHKKRGKSQWGNK